MMEIPQTVASIIPVLDGASNWSNWQPKFQHATRTLNPVYWDIFVGNYAAPIVSKSNPQISLDAIATKRKVPPKQFTKQMFGEYQMLNAAINKHVRSQNHTSFVSWKRYETEARTYLNFAISGQVFVEIKSITHAREAYLKLEALYSRGTPEPISNTWKEWLELRYQNTTPLSFVESFRVALAKLRAEGMELNTDVELTQFKSAISQARGCRSFLVNLHCDQNDTCCMDYVYSSFIRDQVHSDFCCPRQQ